MLDDREQLGAPSYPANEGAQVQGQPGSALPVARQINAAGRPARPSLRAARACGVVAGVRRRSGSGRGSLFRPLLVDDGALHGSDRRRLRGRQELDAVAQGLRLHRRRRRRGQRAGQGRRRHRPHRRRRLPAGGADRARPDRGSAGHHRTLRQADHRARGGGRPGQGAARLRQGRRHPRRSRIEAPAGPGDAPDQQPRFAGAGAGQLRPGRGCRAGRRCGDRVGGCQRRGAEGAARRGHAAPSSSSRHRSPRPSAISPSP